MPQISKKIIYLIFLIYALVGTVVLLVFYHNRWNDSIYNLQFCYGNLLKNMIELGEYKSVEYPARPDIYFTSHRLPSIPYLIFFLSKIFNTKSIGWLSLAKNLVFTLILAYSFILAIKDKKLSIFQKYLALGFIISFPQIIVHFLELGIEEAYVIPVLALFWAILSNQNIPTTSEKRLFVILIPALFFVKNTFLYICPILIFLQYLKFKDKKVVFISSILLLLSVSFTTFFNYIHSGKLTYKYSLEGWNIYNGNCPRTFDYYPKYTIDLIDYKNPIVPPKETVKTEWDLDEFFKEKAIDYISNHPAETFRGMFVKAFTVMLDIRPNGLQENTERFDSKIKYIGAFYMLIFRLLMWLNIIYSAIIIFGKMPKTQKIYAWSYLFFVFSFCLPYVLAFGFERHIIPLVIPVVYSSINFYLFWKENQLAND